MISKSDCPPTSRTLIHLQANITVAKVAFERRSGKTGGYDAASASDPRAQAAAAVAARREAARKDFEVGQVMSSCRVFEANTDPRLLCRLFTPSARPQRSDPLPCPPLLSSVPGTLLCNLRGRGGPHPAGPLPQHPRGGAGRAARALPQVGPGSAPAPPFCPNRWSPTPWQPCLTPPPIFVSLGHWERQGGCLRFSTLSSTPCHAQRHVGLLVAS